MLIDIQHKPKKSSSYVSCIHLIDEYTTNLALRDALVTYLNLKCERKELFVTQWKGLLKKLSSYTSNDTEKLNIVNQSIAKGWGAFYPINSYNKFGEHSGMSCDEIKEELRGEF